MVLYAGLLQELQLAIEKRRTSIDSENTDSASDFDNSPGLPRSFPATPPFPDPVFYIAHARKAQLLEAIRNYSSPQSQELLRSLVSTSRLQGEEPRAEALAVENAPPPSTGWSLWKLLGY